MSGTYYVLNSTGRHLEDDDWSWEQSLKRYWWLWCFFLVIPFFLLLLCCCVCYPSGASKSKTEKRKRKEEEKRVQQALEQQQQQQQQQQPQQPQVATPTVVHYNVVHPYNPSARPSNAGQDVGAPPLYSYPAAAAPHYYGPATPPPPPPYYGGVPAQQPLSYPAPAPAAPYPEPNMYGHYYGIPPPIPTYDVAYRSAPAANDDGGSKSEGAVAVPTEPSAQNRAVPGARTQRESELNQRKAELETQVQLLTAALHNREVHGAVPHSGPTIEQQQSNTLRPGDSYPSAQ